MLTTYQKQLIQQTVPVLKANGQALTDYFYHRMLSQVPELKETFNMGHQRDGKQAKALANAVLAYAENIEDPGVLLPVVNMICQKHVSLNIQAPDYAVVGDHLLHSISEVLSVPMENELISAWAIAYHQLADSMIETEKGIYTQLAQEKGGWTGWREFTIVKKVSETTTVSSIYLAPTDKLALPDYLPGQYISVRVQVPSLGYKQPRQYSLSTAPNRQFFRITVKEENLSQEPGYVSSVLHQQMQIGDRIEVSAPIGDFIIQDATKDNVLISAGIGITPMIAMLEGLTQTLTSSSPSAINFIHVTQDAAHYALSAEVNRLTEQHSCIKTLIHSSQVPATQRGGRFTLESVPPSLLPENADFYLCGPTEFIQSVYNGLLQRGISPSRIHYEVFTTGGLTAA